MKVVLVHGRYANSWEALGLGLIAAYVKRHRRHVDFEFFQGCFDSDAAMYVGGLAAGVMAFSCTSPAFAHAASLAAAVKAKNPQVRTVIGGYHASAVPEQCLAAGFDQVVVGEGENALLQIIEGKRDPIVRGRPMQFLELPWPDRELIKNERNIRVAAAENHGVRMTSFQAHRGCPFQCTYCGDGQEKVVYGKPHRMGREREVGDLLAEIVAVSARYKLGFFKFCDSTWNQRVCWVNDFCRAKMASSAATLPWFANLHANAVTEEMVDLMWRSGCRQVAIGVESGSEKVLAAIGKGTTRASIARACGLAKAAGLHVRGYFILGVPEEDEQDLAETEAFAADLNLDEYGFSMLCPYPGSTYYREDADRFKDVDWSTADEYGNTFWRSHAVSNERLREWQRRLTAKFKERLTQRQPVTP